MTAYLHVDFETRSTLDLRKVGLHNYARHPTTDVWCCGMALGDGKIGMSTLADKHWIPPDFAVHVKSGGTVVAHNAAFELTIWNEVMVPRYGWPVPKPGQCQCTMAMAYAMALPGALENAAAAVGLDARKDMAGHRLMLQMAAPRSLDPLTWWDDPARLERLYDYCKTDVEVERQLYKRLLALPPTEQALWLLDQRINNRGVYVDRAAVQAAIEIVESEQTRLNQEMRRVTNNAVATCSAVGQLGDWIRFRGVAMPGVAKADVLDALTDDTLPPDVAKALRLRQEAAKTSTAKLKKMMESASGDGRLRGMFQYHGAGTGRWAARKVQLHNLPRPKIGQPEIDGIFHILSKPDPAPHKARLIDMMYGPPLDNISSCLRGMLTAGPGKHLIAGDFANIEGRGIAWLAGEQWKLNAFQAHDNGVGSGIYELAYGRAFGVDPAEVTSEQRQVGKVMELALGYQGGVGAFQMMAKGYNVAVPDAQAEEFKLRWREVHPAVVNYWYALEAAAIDAVLHPGVVTTAGPAECEVKFRVKGSFLWCKLPSGRNLCYPYPKMKPRETPWGEMKDQIHYMTVDGQSNKWVETHTYGGKLSENITQAISRDILAHAMNELEKRHYDIVLHVHDEVVVEVPEDAKPSTMENVARIMELVPEWAFGFPIKVKAWRGVRYRK
ncbi:MAG: DNA polymerase [Deltaproteobacteria bacterium]|nr:DNA polymerase [Deltaproteobacteria bacterium]